MAIRLQDDLWEGASALRRAEWRTLIADLAEEIEIEHVRIAMTEAAISLSCDGRVIELPQDLVAPHIDEYVAIVKKMVREDAGAPRLEVLDMAKKVVHDRAARALAAHAPGFAREHEAHRRLFTLIVALRVDTTKFPGAHGHRRS